MILFIDCGHGGNDPGASKNGFIEAEYVFKIGAMLKSNIEKLEFPIKCILSRNENENPSLQESADFAKKENANLVICLHCNAGDPESHGVMGFHFPQHKESQDISNTILKAFPEPLYRQNRFSIPAHKEVWPRVRNVIEPYERTCVLLELGFITNAIDRESMSSSIIAESITMSIIQGVLRYCYLHANESWSV